MEIGVEVGNYIKQLRKLNGDKQVDLARKLSIDKSYLSRIEKGQEKQANLELLQKIAHIYDVDITYFFGDTMPIPEELKSLGVGWIGFINDMNKEGFTPEEVKRLIDFAKKIKSDANDL